MLAFSSLRVIPPIVALCFLLCSCFIPRVSPKFIAKDDTTDPTNVSNKQTPGRSSFRAAPKQPQVSPSTNQQQQLPANRREFRIGVIVPRTAFLSQYKTYTQRIKDTFNQMLQLSRHQQVKRKQTPNVNPSSSPLSSQLPFQTSLSATSSLASTPAAGSSTSSSSQQTASADNKLPTSSCLSNSRSLPSSSSSHHHLHHQQHHKQSMPWPNLIFNQYFDTKVVDLVNLTARSSVQEIIDSMCHGLIEQNVSVIVYLENNQDQTVSSSLDSASSTVQALSSLEPFQTTLPQRQTPNKSQLTSMKSAAAATAGALNEDETRQTTGNASSVSVLIPSPASMDGSSLRAGRWSSSEVQQASSQAHFIMHLAHSAGIPMIAWSVTATLAQRPKKQRTLHLAPTVAHEAKAMLAILERYSWHSFSVVSTTLAGHDDFILAIRQLVAASNSNPQQQQQQQNLSSTSSPHASDTVQQKSQEQPSSASPSPRNQQQQQQRQREQISAQPSKAFKLLDVITIKKRTLIHIEQELRQLTVSESRVILLYATKGEAIDILKVANRLRLTKRSYAWIVAQSVIGSNENERAPAEFHPGLLGVYFRSNHERLLDELSRAITIIAHGLERLVRDRSTTGDSPSTNTISNSSSSKVVLDTIAESTTAGSSPRNGSENDDYDATASSSTDEHLRTKQHKLLASHSKCYGPMEELSERRADLLYEYFRKSSPFNVFDADGSLKDVELSVVNLDNERQWRRIGCFSDAKLTIDDITWPEQAERPPSGTMEKFHLRAVFLEEPSFVNLAEPDAETNECKTNRAVKCRYKVLNNSTSGPAIISIGNAAGVGSSASAKKSEATNNHTSVIQDDYEFRCCSGFCIDLMEKFAADLKFTYDLYRVPDGYWGILENNTWNGLIGEIVSGEADVIVSSVKVNSDRQKAVDFTVPFLDTGISIIVAKQTGVIAKLAFLEPFDTLAWIMFICVGIPLAATSIFFFEWLSPGGFYAGARGSPFATGSSSVAKEKQQPTNINQPLTTREAHKFSFCRTLWLVITILFGSAAHIDSPKGYTARFMSNVWATFAVVFLAVYTANLAAFMITREEYLELSGIGGKFSLHHNQRSSGSDSARGSLMDLFKSPSSQKRRRETNLCVLAHNSTREDSKLAYPYHRHPALKFGTITGGNTHAVLSANKPNLYNYMKAHNLATVEEGVDAVKTGQLDAFVYDALVLDYLASQDPECRLVNVGAWYSMTGYALAFPRKSRYFEKFDMKMLEYRKNGELDRLRRFWLQGQCKPGQSRHSISKPLDLSQFMSAFLLLGAGILCAVFVLLLEHLYVMFLRDRLMSSRHRKKLMSILYPFSLSLTDTLRLAEDDDPTTDNKCKQQQQRHSPGCYKLEEALNENRQEASTELSTKIISSSDINHCANFNQTNSSILNLIEAIDDNEANILLLLKRPAEANRTGADEPACISDFRLARLKSLLSQLKEFVLDEEDQEEESESHKSHRRKSCFDQPQTSVGKLSICGNSGGDGMATSNNNLCKRQAQISRRIWRQRPNNNVGCGTKNLSISLGDGLNKKTTNHPSKCKHFEGKKKFDTIGASGERRDGQQNSKQTESVASNFGNKETLL